MTKNRFNILVTGFEPFAGLNENPSQELALALQEQHTQCANIESYVLPVDYQKTPIALDELFKKKDWSLFLALGLARSRTAIEWETVAQNICSDPRQDNSGQVKNNTPIKKDYPKQLYTNTTAHSLEYFFNKYQIPFNHSKDAGTYLCNLVFFQALATLNKTVPVHFLHIPLAQVIGPEKLLHPLLEFFEYVLPQK